MSTYKHIAIAGGLTAQGPLSASLGAFFARALLNEKAQGVSDAEVIILGRASAMTSPAAKEFAALGAKTVSVDYDNHASLVEALKGVEVVISTLAGPGFGSQLPLAKASKEAGVQLFVPSEYGNDTTKLAEGDPLYGKTAFQHQLKEVGVPMLLLFNGFFADWLIPMGLEVDKDNKIVLVGEQTTDVSFTQRSDVARYLAYILLHLPPSQLQNTTFPIETTRTSFLSLAKLLQSKHPGSQITHQTHEWAWKRLKEEGDFTAFLKVMWDKGEGHVGVNGRDESGRVKECAELWEKCGGKGKRAEEFVV